MNAEADPAPPVAALALVPGLESGAAPLRIERLGGGSVNDSWRVDTAQGRFVLRIDGPVGRRPGVERARERRIHEQVARVGLAPRALAWADAAGVQVREFLDGRVWQERDLLQPEQQERLGARLAQLHAIKPPERVTPFDPGVYAQQYLRLINAAPAADPATNARAFSGASAAATAVQAAAARVAAHGIRPAIVHGDLTHANVLDGRQLWLLDWEYAQCADPVYDVACALAYCPAARPLAPRLLAAAGLAGADRRGRLEDAILVYEGLTRLWHLARGTGVHAG